MTSNRGIMQYGPLYGGGGSVYCWPIQPGGIGTFGGVDIFFFFFFWLCFLVVCLCAVLCFVFRCPNQVSIEVVDMILNQESGRDETCENFFAIAGFDFCFPIGI